MADVARLEKVLGVRLQEERVEFIQQNYSAFYQDPESFIGDGLVDMILEDIGLKKPESLMEILEAVPGMDVKHTDTKGTLAWGNFKGELMYALYATDARARDLATLQSVDISGLPSEALVAVVVRSYDGYQGVIIVQERGSIDNIGGSPETLYDIPGFEILAVFPVFNETYMLDSAQFYVPFMKAGNGRNPVMWLSFVSEHLPDADEGLIKKINDGCDFEMGVDVDSFKDLKLNLGNYYPAVDLETQRSERYKALDGCNQQLVYNRNALAYSGNIHTPDAMLPWAVDCMLAWSSKGNVDTNMYEVATGKFEWDDIYFDLLTGEAKSGNGSQPNTEATKVDEPGSKVFDSEFNRDHLTGPQGKELGKSGATTRLGKALANATGSYQQESLD